MTTKKSTLPNDYERMIPAYHKGYNIYGEHIARYKVAQDLVKGKDVLDIACGSGYGTSLIAESAKHVTGVDVSEVSIQYASEYYDAKNITYKVGNGEHIPCEDATFDVVVSFETIEHIRDYEQFMRECKRVLKPDGLLLLSTPNDVEFAEGNHFHLHEFEESELKNLIKKYFSNIKPYYQATWISNIVGSAELMTKEWDGSIQIMQTAPINPQQYLYFYFLCANRKITENFAPLLVIGEHYSERVKVQKESETLAVIKELEGAKAELQRIKNTTLYKLYRQAHSITRLLKRKGR